MLALSNIIDPRKHHYTTKHNVERAEMGNVILLKRIDPDKEFKELCQEKYEELRAHWLHDRQDFDALHQIMIESLDHEGLQKAIRGQDYERIGRAFLDFQEEFLRERSERIVDQEYGSTNNPDDL